MSPLSDQIIREQFVPIFRQIGLPAEILLEDTEFMKRFSQGKKCEVVTAFRFREEQVNRRAKIKPYWDVITQKYELKIFFEKNNLHFDQPYFGYVFTPSDQVKLEQYSELGRIVDLFFSGRKVKCLIGIDSYLNCFVHTPVTAIQIDDVYNGVQISIQEKLILKNGGKIYKEGFIDSCNGEHFNGVLMFSNETEGIVCLKPNPTLLLEIKNMMPEWIKELPNPNINIQKMIDKEDKPSIVRSAKLKFS